MQPLRDLVSEMAERAKQREAEHLRRLAEDPEYRAEHERREAQVREREAAEKRRAERQRREELVRRRNEKGIPEKFWTHLDAWRADPAAAMPASVTAAHASVQRFLERRVADWVFLFFAGPPGTGKTTAAAWFLDAPGQAPDAWTGEMRVAEVAGRFVTAEQIAKAGAYDNEFWDGLRDAPRLAIDDLGVEQLDQKGWALANLTHLLSHRHAHQLPTLITMNLTKAAFLERYAQHDGGRLRDRLGESAWFVSVEGPSLRKRLALGADPSSET